MAVHPSMASQYKGLSPSKISIRKGTVMSFGLILAYIFIFLSPIEKIILGITPDSIRLWMVSSVLGAIVFGPFLIFPRLSLRNHALLAFFLYFGIIAIIGVYHNPVVIQTNALFIVSLLLFLGFVRGALLNLDFERLDKLLLMLFAVAMFGAAWQILSKYTSVPFPDAHRGRSYQISGFFAEPAFFALFLFSSFYYFLYSTPRPRIFLAFFAFVGIIVCQSLGGIVASATLLGFFAIRSMKITRRGVSVFAVGSTVLIVCTFLFLSFENGSTKAYVRFTREVVQNVSAVGYDPEYGHGSGYTRTINEINFIIKTLKESPLLGYGASGYLDGSERRMALNAFTEIIVRWGLVGIALIFAAFYAEKRSFRPRSSLSFWVFLVLYGCIDGAIAKPEFLLPLAIVLAADRVNSYRYWDRANVSAYRSARSSNVRQIKRYPLRDNSYV